MPSKGKRVASRQSSLRRRRGNQNQNQSRRATAVAAGSPETIPTAGAVSLSDPALAGATPQTPATAAAAPFSPPRGRRFDRPAAYNYVRSELTRIGIFSGILLVILVAVSFVL